MLGAGVFLGNFVNGEVGNVDVGSESWFEWGADAAKLFPDDATEEWVALDLHGTSMLSALLTNAVFRVAKEARERTLVEYTLACT